MFNAAALFFDLDFIWITKFCKDIGFYMKALVTKKICENNMKIWKNT